VTAGYTYQYRVYSYNGEWSATFSRVEIVASNIPLPPENVTAESNSGKVNISWSAVEGATKYLLQRRYNNGSGWKSWGTISSEYTGTSYVDNKVTAGYTYQYRVYSYNGEWSSTFTRVEVVASNIPLPPGNMTAESDSGKVNVSWSTVEGATKYLLQRRYNDGNGWKSWGTISSGYTETSYEDNRVTAGYTYQYRVYSYNGEWSATFTRAEVVASNIPLPPANMTAESSAGKVNVSWSAVAGATKYLLQRRYNDGTGWKSWTTISSSMTGTSYEDSRVTAGYTYQYRVYAYNGEWSTFTRVEVVATSVPLPPENMSAESSAGKIDVNWSAVTGATKYLLQRRYNDGTSWKGWATISSEYTGTSYEDSRVTAGYTYQYRVYSYNGEWSTTFIRAEVVATSVPLPPENLTAESSAGKIDVNWSTVAGATKYLLQRRYNDGTGWKGWATISSEYTGTSYEDSRVTAGYTYQYRVYAYNGKWSTFIRVEVVASSAPLPPSNMTAEYSAGKVNVSWSAVTGATQYLLQRRYNDGNGWKGWATISSEYTGTSYEDSRVTAGYTYQYRVYAYNGEWSTFTRVEVETQ
jgi:hypothetical protein